MKYKCIETKIRDHLASPDSPKIEKFQAVFPLTQQTLDQTFERLQNDRDAADQVLVVAKRYDFTTEIGVYLLELFARYTNVHSLTTLTYTNRSDRTLYKQSFTA